MNTNGFPKELEFCTSNRSDNNELASIEDNKSSDNNPEESTGYEKARCNNSFFVDMHNVVNDVTAGLTSIEMECTKMKTMLEYINNKLNHHEKMVEKGYFKKTGTDVFLSLSQSSSGKSASIQENANCSSEIPPTSTIRHSKEPVINTGAYDTIYNGVESTISGNYSEDDIILCTVKKEDLPDSQDGEFFHCEKTEIKAETIGTSISGTLNTEKECRNSPEAHKASLGKTVLKDMMNITPKQQKDAAHKRKPSDATNDIPKKSAKSEEASIFIGGLSYHTKEEDLLNFLDKNAVNTIGVRIISVDGKSRGFGYADFDRKEEFDKCIELNGLELDGCSLRCNPAFGKPHSRKKRGHSGRGDGRGGGQGRTNNTPTKLLMVKNLSYNIDDDGLHSVFPDVGSVRVAKNWKTGNSRGFGVVEYDNVEMAKKASEKMQGQEIDGRPVRIVFGTSRESFRDGCCGSSGYEGSGG